MKRIEKRLAFAINAALFFLLASSCMKGERLGEIDDLTISSLNGIEFDYLESDAKLLEHSRSDTGSFIVFINNDFLRTKVLDLSSQSYETKIRRLTSVYSELLNELSISTAKLGLVFANFNGFEVELNENELHSLMNNKDIKNVFINRKIVVDLPKPEPIADSDRIQLNSGIAPANIEFLEPGVELVWSINPATAAHPDRTAWILDTGVDLDHVDLNIDAFRSVSFVSGESTAEDLNGHGTHVAGIVGAKYDGFGVVGVAPNAKIVAVKVLNSVGAGSNATILAGLDYVLDNAEPQDVVNMSIQSSVDDPSTVLDNAIINVADNASVNFAICAGNYKANTANRPMARIVHDRVYIVGATKNYAPEFAVDFFSGGGSNWGTNIVSAPGVNIFSTWKNGAYHTLTGTSMAAPHVAGLLMYDVTCNCDCEPICIPPFCDPNALRQSQQSQSLIGCVLRPSVQYVTNYPYGDVPEFMRKRKWFKRYP